MIILLIITIFTLVMALRSIFVVIGVYKDPVLATFESYGEERFFSPLVMLIVWVTVFGYVCLYWYLDANVLFMAGMLFLLPISALHRAIFAFLVRHSSFFERYPAWYHNMLTLTDREERRRIAYLWLFLPPATRMIYNVNTTLFNRWMEQVLLTVNQ